MDEVFAVGTESGTGARLNERYRLGARLGGGGMAVVYRAVDEVLGREVAVKLLDPRRYGGDDGPDRFEREARAAASIGHPNVVAVHDYGRDGDVLFIVMECLPGRTLADEVRSGPRPTGLVGARLGDVLAGLAAAHDKDILHRDIKPGNVLITADDRAKLADFGIATFADEDRTETGLVVGTAAYLAPERVRGARATPRSDIYSVGVVAYEALAGRRPFVESSPLALAYAITAGDAPSLGVARPDLAPELCAVVARAMSVDPDARFASAREFARHLDAALRTPTPADGLPATAPVVVPAEHRTHATEVMHAPVDVPRDGDVRPGRRGRRRLAALAVMLVTALGIGVAIAATRDDGPTTADSPPPSTVPGSSLPPGLEAPFDRLEEAVQP